MRKLSIFLLRRFAKPFEEAGLILVVSENIRFVDPSHHDMVQSAGDV